MNPKDLRQVHRIVLFNKARKKLPHKIPPICLAILCIVNIHGPLTGYKIRDRLYYINYGGDTVYVFGRIRLLVEYGLLSHSKPIYSLTPEGLAYLLELEKRLRKVRIDK